MPTTLAERGSWMRGQIFRLLFLVVTVSVFRHYGLKKLGTSLVTIGLVGGVVGFFASFALGWLLQIGIDLVYFGVLGHEDLEELAPGVGRPIVLGEGAKPAHRPSPIRPGDGTPENLHRRAIEADQRGEGALCWLLFRRFFAAPAGDLAALRLPLAAAEKRFRELDLVHTTWSADAWVTEASRLSNDKRRDDADLCADRALELDPAHPGAWSQKAVSAFVRGQMAMAMANLGGGSALGAPAPHFEEAVRAFDRSLAGAPDQIGSLETKAMALFFLKRPEEARAPLARARALRPKGEKYLDVSDDGKAIVACTPDEDDDKSADAWEAEGHAHADAQRLDQALAAYQRAVAIDPDRPALLREIGVGLALRKAYDQALASFDKSLAIAPEDALTWDHKGVALARMGRPADAIVALDQALALRPDEAATWIHKGSALSLDGQREAALSCFDKALSLDPARIEVELLREAELSKLGRHDASLKALERFVAGAGPDRASLVIEVKHRIADLRLRRARSAALPASIDLEQEALEQGQRGDLDAALRLFEQAVKADPRNAAAWSNRANALSELGRHEEALHSAETSLKIDPRSPDAWGNKGRALAQLRRDADALTCFEKAIAHDPKHTMSHYNRAVSLLKSGRTEEGLTSLERTLELDPDHPLGRKLMAHIADPGASADG